MRRLLSYAKSHIYDLHALLAGTIAFGIMMLLKQYLPNKYWGIVCTFLISFVVFCGLSLISPLIEFSAFTGLMSAVYAFCEAAIFEQLGFRKKEE